MFLLYLGNLGRKDIVSPFPLKYLKMGVLFGQSPLIYLILELQRYPSYYALRKERVHSKPNCPRPLPLFARTSQTASASK